MTGSEPWRYKYDEIKRLKDNIFQILESYESKDELKLKDTFMSFCNNCHNLCDWLKKNGIDLIKRANENTYLDICRGVTNGDKHYKITQYLDTYNSVFYRTSTESLFQSSTGYAGDSSNPLYQNPKDDILVVETKQGKYGIREIVDNSIEAWDALILKYLRAQHKGSIIEKDD